MHKDLFKKFIDQTPVYFPTIALFYALDKTQQPADLIVLLLAFWTLAEFDNIIDSFKLNLNEKAVKTLSLKKRKNEVCDYILRNVKEKMTSSRKTLILFYIMILLLNIYAYKVLISLWYNNTAKFLIIIAGTYNILQIFNYLKYFKRSLKRALNAEL